MIALLILTWVIAAIVGFVVHGLFWLFVVACVLFVATPVTRAGRACSRASLQTTDPRATHRQNGIPMNPENR